VRGERLKDKVQIRDRRLRKRVLALLREVLSKAPKKERELVLAHLKRVVSRSEAGLPKDVSPAFVQKLNGDFEMVIEPEEFMSRQPDEQLAIIEHELDEIVGMLRREESIHELEFVLFSREVEGYKEKCIVCGQEVNEGYHAYSGEEVSLYIEELCTRLEVDSEDLFVCIECMSECCSSCEKYSTCHKVNAHYKVLQEISCRYPELWVKRAIALHDKYRNNV